MRQTNRIAECFVKIAALLLLQSLKTFDDHKRERFKQLRSERIDEFNNIRKKISVMRPDFAYRGIRG